MLIIRSQADVHHLAPLLSVERVSYFLPCCFEENALGEFRLSTSLRIRCGKHDRILFAGTPELLGVYTDSISVAETKDLRLSLGKPFRR